MLTKKDNTNLLKIFLQSLDHIAEGLLISDNLQEDNPIIYVNKGFIHLTGYSKKEILGKNCRYLQGKETDQKTIEIIRESVHTHKPCFVEIINYKKDGTLFWNQLSITPIKDKEGNVTNFVGIQRDISKEKLLLKRSLEVNAMKTTLSTINDLIFNFMNTVQYLMSHFEEHPAIDKKIINEFDKEYATTLKKLRRINELEEFKEKKIGNKINVLDIE